MIAEYTVMIPTRDKTCLATDIFRPETDEPLPVLVARTPYDKSLMEREKILPFVEAAYAVIVQDVRGRYASEGDFSPYVHETRDALDLYEWILAQPWCDGNIGTFGGSYLGGMQWLPARENPRGLKAMVPEITFDNLYTGCMYQGGAKVLHDLRWTVASIIPEAARRARERGEIGEIELPDVDNALNEIPLATHRLHREAGGCFPGRTRHAAMRRHFAREIPGVLRAARIAHTG